MKSIDKKLDWVAAKFTAYCDSDDDYPDGNRGSIPTDDTTISNIQEDMGADDDEEVRQLIDNGNSAFQIARSLTLKAIDQLSSSQKHEVLDGLLKTQQATREILNIGRLREALVAEVRSAVEQAL